MDSFVLPSGSILKDRYCLQRLIHEDGPVLEYMAQDIANGARYRVRQVHAVYSDPATSRRHRQHFRDTAPQLIGMHHRALAAVVDCFDQGPDFFTVSAWVDGPSLSTVPGPVTPEVALRWVLDILDAMEIVSTRSDRIGLPELSPNTIRVRDNGTIVIGCLRCLEDGTPPPASFPFHSGEAVRSFKSDVYTLGALTWWLLSGQVPPNPTERRLANRPLAAPHGLPQALARGLMAMLHLDPRRRPSSSSQARQLLIYGGAPRPEGDRRARRSRLNVPLVAAAALLMVVVLGVLAVPVVSRQLTAMRAASQRRSTEATLASAKDSFKQGDYRATIHQIEQAGPFATADDRLMLAEAQVASGDPVAARKTLDGFDRGQVGGDYWLIGARTEAALGRPDLAQVGWQRATDALSAQHDAVSRWRLGEVYLDEGRYDQAVEALEAARSQNPGLWRANVDLAVAMAAQGRADGARTLLQQGEVGCESSLALGQLYYAQGAFEAAAAAYHTALQKCFANENGWLGLARVELATGEWDEALAAAWRAARVAPNSPTAWVMVEHCLLVTDQPARALSVQVRAEQMLQAAVRRTPTSEQCLAAGQLMLDENRPQTAVEWLSRNPNSPPAWRLLGLAEAGQHHDAAVDNAIGQLQTAGDRFDIDQIRLVQGNLAVAEVDLEELNRLNPTEGAYKLALGECLARLGQTEEASRWLARACLAHPACTHGLLLLADCEQRLKQGELSAVHLEKLCELDGRPQYFANAGERWMQCHRWPQAIRCYLIGGREHPDDPRFKFWVGRCYQAVGRYLQAAVEYKQFLHKSPHGAMADDARQRLARMDSRTSRRH